MQMPPERSRYSGAMTHDTLTDRLALTPIDPFDEAMVAGIFAIQSDPATWTHLPEGCETDISQSRQLAEAYARSWRDQGLGWWAITLRVPMAGLPKGALVGLGGAGIRVPEIPAWNLGYRLAPAVWGHGLAGELSRTAIAAAHRAQPDVPVVGRALTRNQASWRVLERVGLSLLWEGEADADDPITSGLARRIYGDRPVGDDLLDQLIALG